MRKTVVLVGSRLMSGSGDGSFDIDGYGDCTGSGYGFGLCEYGGIWFSYNNFYRDGAGYNSHIGSGYGFGYGTIAVPFNKERRTW